MPERSPSGFLVRFLILAVASGVAIGMTKAGNTLLALHLGAEPWQANLLAAAEAVGMALVTIPAGFIIARFGARPVYLMSSLVAALAYTLSPWATAWWHLLFVAVIVGLCIPFRVVAMSGSFLARLGELGPSRSGWYRGSLMTGMWLIGPLLGGAILAAAGIQALYAIVSLVFLAMAVGSRAVLPEPGGTPGDGVGLRAILAGTRALLANPEVRRPCLAECNAGLTGGFFATFSIILAKQGFAQDETGAVLPLVAQGGAFVLVLFAAGQTLAWVAPRDLWRVAQAAVVAGLATIGLAGSFSVLLAGAALLGTGLALQHLASVHVLARSGADKGRASGIFTFSGTAGTLVGLIGSGVASRFLPLHEVFLAWIPVFLLIAWGLPAAETLRRGWDGLRSAALRSIPALGVLAVVVAAWDLSARFALVPVHIVVPPLVVAETLVDLARSGDLWVHVQASLVRVGIGFAIGALAGNLYGILHGLSPVLRAVAGPTFHLIRQVPTIGWIPLLILAFGIDEPFKIVVIALGVFFPVALATIDGVAGVPRRFLEVADVLRFGAWTRVTRVVLPAALPDIATGLRIGLSRAWMLIVAAELFGADAGVGHLMDWGRQLFQLDLLIAALLLTGLIGFIIDRFIAWMERRFLGWRLPSGA